MLFISSNGVWLTLNNSDPLLINNIPSKDEDDIAGANNYLRAALDAMAAGKTIEDNITRPCGCSVKHWSANNLPGSLSLLFILRVVLIQLPTRDHTYL